MLNGLINLHQTGIFAEDEAFWLEEFKDVPASVELLTDYPRRGELSNQGGRISSEFGEQLSEQINDFCAKQGLTPTCYSWRL